MMVDVQSERVETIWYVRDKNRALATNSRLRRLRRKPSHLNSNIEQTKTLETDLPRAGIGEIRAQEIPGDPPLTLSRQNKPQWHLAFATIFMEDIWGLYLLDKFPIENSPFEFAAQAVEPYWHFIFTIRMIVCVGWDQDLTWRVHDFVFSDRAAQQSTMDKIAEKYTERFHQSVDVDKATSWLNQKRSRTALQSCGHNLEAFDSFTSSRLSNTRDSVSVEYLIFLTKGEHHDLLQSWYNNGGMFDGIKSIKKIASLRANRWQDIVKDCDLYKLAVKAICAFDASIMIKDEMYQLYRQSFSGCALFLCARFKLLQEPKMEDLIAQLEKYEPSTTPGNGQLAVVLSAKE